MPRAPIGGVVGGRGTGKASGQPGTVPVNAEPGFPAGSVPASPSGFTPFNFGSPGARKESFMLKFKQRFPGLFGL